MMNALIKNNDGSLIRLNWHRQRNGKFSVDINRYGSDGYYMAAFSMIKRDMTKEQIDRAIDPAENPHGTVELY
jgi:hypothetical protein